MCRVKMLVSDEIVRFVGFVKGLLVRLCNCLHMCRGIFCFLTNRESQVREKGSTMSVVFSAWQPAQSRCCCFHSSSLSTRRRLCADQRCSSPRARRSRVRIEYASRTLCVFQCTSHARLQLRIASERHISVSGHVGYAHAAVSIIKLDLHGLRSVILIRLYIAQDGTFCVLL